MGFYTELDFLNEAGNQQRLTDLLAAEGVDGIYIPKVYHNLSTRRVLVSEWIDGCKVCVYVCLSVCMYVCMCVCVFMYVALLFACHLSGLVLSLCWVITKLVLS